VLVAAVSLLLHVTGPANGVTTSNCFLRLRAHLTGGGSMVYCLKTFRGAPGPGATVHDSGTLLFVLPRGSIRARVSIVQRFGSDGMHATQTLTGTLTGGTGNYKGARGTLRGGGTDVETAPGRITASNLRYRVTLRAG